MLGHLPVCALLLESTGIINRRRRHLSDTPCCLYTVHTGVCVCAI